MKRKHLLIGVIIVLVSTLFDQVTKMLALMHLKDGKIVVVDGFFELVLHYNNGAAWSSFAGNFGFLMAMTVVSIIAFLFFFRTVDFNLKKCYSIGISLMLGGLFGNMIDRIFMDGNVVIDFLAFDFGSYSFPTFNIADSCLVVGVVLFVLDILLFESKRKGEKNEQVQS